MQDRNDRITAELAAHGINLPGRELVTRVAAGNPDPFDRQLLSAVTSVVALREELDELCSSLINRLERTRHRLAAGVGVSAAEDTLGADGTAHDVLCARLAVRVDALHTIAGIWLNVG